MFGRQWDYDVIKKTGEMLVDVWIKDVFITLGFFLLVFSLWIPLIVYEVIAACLLSLAFSPMIKERIRRALK